MFYSSILFFWLCQVLVVGSSLQHTRSSSLTRDWTWASCSVSVGILTTRLPGKSQIHSIWVENLCFVALYCNISQWVPEVCIHFQHEFKMSSINVYNSVISYVITHSFIDSSNIHWPSRHWAKSTVYTTCSMPFWNL